MFHAPMSAPTPRTRVAACSLRSGSRSVGRGAWRRPARRGRVWPSFPNASGKTFGPGRQEFDEDVNLMAIEDDPAEHAARVRAIRAWYGHGSDAKAA